MKRIMKAGMAMLVSASSMVSAQDANPDSENAAVVVRGHTFEVDVLQKDVRAFGNRKYVFDVVPKELEGWQFTRLNGGMRSGLRIRAKRDTVIHGATSVKSREMDLADWTPHPTWALHYTDGGHTRMPVFSRTLRAGEDVRVPEGSWTGMVLLAPKLEAEVVDLHPEFKTVPGVVIDHIRSGNRIYIGSPSIAILPSGTYLASHDLFGGNSGADKQGITRVFRSHDRGETWERLDDVKGMFWATVFSHEGAAYLMGNDRRYGFVVIRKSTDEGNTWTVPEDAKSGLLLTGARYHCASVPVLEHNGRIWRAMEDAEGGGGWGKHFRSFMMSAPADADLLDAANWTSSNRLPRDPAWRDGRFIGWLEGNAVAAPDGSVVNILRAEDPKFGWLAALIKVSADGKTSTFDPETGFIPLPGGNHNKFTIRFDPESKLYWSLTNYRAGPHDVRNALALTSSPDLLTWDLRCVVLYHPESGTHGFQYVDWQFDGDDIVVASRTGYADGFGGAHNFHDANYFTFHRLKCFRKLTMADSHPLFQLYYGSSVTTEERQVTTAKHGHILTNINVWSPDNTWLAYDVRKVGNVFNGNRIERVNVETGNVDVLYTSENGANCAVVTCHPTEDKVVFIHGPENPTADWSYAAHHRRGVTVSAAAPGKAENLDARDLSAPFTPGALRGGTHVHTFSGDGTLVSSTYEDHVLAELGEGTGHDQNQRNVVVSVLGQPVSVTADHPRNHNGQSFMAVVTKTVDAPKPGSDEISRAFSDAWVGANGYTRPDGTRQKHAIAFQGHVRTADGETISEVFIVDLPEDLTAPAAAPLEGTTTTRPAPPRGVTQRRLTHTANRPHPGLRGPRHWLRSSHDGSSIAFLMEDDSGIVQFWTVSPNGGEPTQVTHNPWDVQSAFSWSPDGQQLAYVMDNSVFMTDVGTGSSVRLTERRKNWEAPHHYCCAFSPNGKRIAFTRPVRDGEEMFDQVFVVDVPE